MNVTIVPFTEDHLGPAAVLLAARHQNDRVSAPALSPRYLEPDATLKVVRKVLAEEGMEGVAALRDDNVVGFLLGAPAFSTPSDAFAGLMRPRSVEIPYAGHAVAASDAQGVYRALYAALAAQWVARGLTAHYITFPLARDAAETWSDLGFGRQVELGVRDTHAPDSVRAPDLTMSVRRAIPDDAEPIQELMTDLFRSFADPAIFLPFLPETGAGRNALVPELLADPGTATWLAFKDGHLAAMHILMEPTSPHWFVSPLQTPERSVYLFLACTTPHIRSSGIGAALLARTMAWARDAGYERCAAHYMTASRAADFWRGQGFQPVSHWLFRVIDDRVTWANGRN